MKNCPYCDATIEENARVCLYCMKELEPKATMSVWSKKRRGLWICALIFGIAVIGAVGYWLLKPPASSSKDQRDKSKEQTSLTQSPDRQGEAASESGDLPKETPSTSGAETTEDDTATSFDDTNSDSGTALGGGTTSGSDTAQDTVPVTQSDSSSSSKTNVEFVYREAKYSVDDYHVTANVDNCVVIVGVSAPASDGIYRIPSTIDGKKVTAVQKNAFSGENIKNTVRQIYLPSSVKTVWNYAFMGCTNLTDIYFYGSSVYIGALAFPPKNQRSGMLTIHCPYDCNNRDSRYYRSIAESYYDAQFEEWNG